MFKKLITSFLRADQTCPWMVLLLLSDSYSTNFIWYEAKRTERQLPYQLPYQLLYYRYSHLHMYYIWLCTASIYCRYVKRIIVHWEMLRPFLANIAAAIFGSQRELNGCAVILRLSVQAHVCGNVRPSGNSLWLDAISHVTSFLK